METPSVRMAIIETDMKEMNRLRKILAPLCSHENLFCFHHPEQALENLPSCPVDVILFNDCMKDFNGIEFLQLLEVPFPNPDMILLSEIQDSRCRAEAFEFGVSDWILKPCTPEEILSRLRRILDFRRMESRIQSLEAAALKDTLTGLWNRKALEEELERISQLTRRYQMNYAVMMIDLDQFKKYNDRYGHLQGDRALEAAGQVVLDTVRKSDFPGRFGGEEFLIILPYTEETGADILAARLVEKIQARNLPHELNPPHYRVSFTVGVAVKTGEEPILSVVRKADEALYYGKKTGKKVVNFSELLNEKAEGFLSPQEGVSVKFENQI